MLPPACEWVIENCISRLSKEKAVSFDGISDSYLKLIGKDNPMFFEYLWHSNI
jgi:hypothetical protein